MTWTKNGVIIEINKYRKTGDCHEDFKEVLDKLTNSKTGSKKTKGKKRTSSKKTEDTA